MGCTILTGQTPADLDLLLVKDFGSLGAVAETLFGDDVTDASAVAVRLGWSSTWARSIVREGTRADDRHDRTADVAADLR